MIMTIYSGAVQPLISNEKFFSVLLPHVVWVSMHDQGKLRGLYLRSVLIQFTAVMDTSCFSRLGRWNTISPSPDTPISKSLLWGSRAIGSTVIAITIMTPGHLIRGGTKERRGKVGQSSSSSWRLFVISERARGMECLWGSPRWGQQIIKYYEQRRANKSNYHSLC